MSMQLAERYASIEAEVRRLSVEAGRQPDEVTVMGVSKTVGLDAVAEAIGAGVHDFGENRPEELARKHDAFPDERWHFIGNIQSRQLRHVVGRAVLIHSLYKIDHARKIDSIARDSGIVQHVLIEVNDGEENKQGLSADDLLDMLMVCESLDNVQVDGLMTMAARSDADAARHTFESLRKLRDGIVEQLVAQGVDDMPLRELSMGMSDDYRLAIPEGSTIVRIGRAIFSDEYQG